MKFFAVATTFFFAATASAQAVTGPNGNCGFPNGPDCVSLGTRNAQGQREFQEPANSPGNDCCLFPLSCGNGDGVAVFPCVKVAGKATGNGKKKNGKAKANAAKAKTARRMVA